MHINLRTRIFFYRPPYYRHYQTHNYHTIPVPVSLTKEPCPWMKMESMTHDGRYIVRYIGYNKYSFLRFKLH